MKKKIGLFELCLYFRSSIHGSWYYVKMIPTHIDWHIYDTISGGRIRTQEFLAHLLYLQRNVKKY